MTLTEFLTGLGLATPFVTAGAVWYEKTKSAEAARQKLELDRQNAANAQQNQQGLRLDQVYLKMFDELQLVKTAYLALQTSERDWMARALKSEAREEITKAKLDELQAHLAAGQQKGPP